MMGTVAQKLQKLLETKEAIRQAIIGKGQSVAGTLPFSSYPAKIDAIQTGMDTSDATAVAGDILSGKTAYVKGSKITGTIASKGAANLTASGASVTVPAGYYPSQVSKSVSTATQDTPSITVDSAGKITASATQSAGYVSAGTKSATKQLTTKAGETITPGTTQKTAVASGRYTTGTVYVAGDANLVSSNIKSGVEIFNTPGSLVSAADNISCTVKNGTLWDIKLYLPKSKDVYLIAAGQTISILTLPNSFVEIFASNFRGSEGMYHYQLGDGSYNCEYLGEYYYGLASGRYIIAQFAFTSSGNLNVIQD